ncbi:predicted protein [Micromonas commoda]|uniref:WAPL domain-containing protein n=1 Tax=Micromonas commoda (strain RCC299 / NOUM17 / CCMP2709) TaxID=296587 RepID=C1FIT0_MICCC|nr:predicted protein [Micromonas commoda]ACO70229.1 predicted protein [Micromonas commoda]|eukprot:XP_002508971.1 predicted protein [Micromonas commoda]
MGFLSKIYERRGAAKLRQARVEQFAASKAAGTSSPAGTTPAQRAPGGSGGAIGSPEWASTGAFSSRGKTLGGSGGSAAKPGPDPYEFDLEDEPVAAANAGVVPSPALAQRLFELQRRESSSPGGGGLPLPPDRLDPTRGSGSPGDADGTNDDRADETTAPKVSRRDEKKRVPSRPAPGKRRRVTFAEVDAYDLPEDESDGDGDGDGEEDSDNESVEIPYSDEEDEVVVGVGGGGDVASSPPRAMIPPDAPLATTPPPPERGPGGEDAGRTKAGEDDGGEPGGGTPVWAKRSLRMTTADTPSPGAKGPAGILKSGPGTVGHGTRGDVPTEMSLSPASSPIVVPSGTSRDVRMNPRDPHTEYAAPSNGVNLPESGDDLADLDEAQYALSGLTRNAPAVGKLTSASTLVRLASDPRSRRVLSAQGLAPRLTLAALQLGREARATHRRGAIDRAAGAVPSRLAKLASASLLYLANLDVRACDAAAAFASDDAALVLATVLEVTPEEEAEERVKAEEASRRERTNGGTNGEATRRDDAKHALSRGGFAALLTRGSDDRCERDISRALTRGLKFLPHEKVDACTLGLLATHRQLVVAEKLAAEAAARATVRQHRRDHRQDKTTTRAMHPEDEDDADVDASQREEDEEEEAMQDEDDEKTVRGWGTLKERLAASGAMLNVARLADDAAREIHRLGAAVFSRGPDEAADEDDESIEADGGVDVESEEEDSKRAAAASRAFARLFRCLRVIESATFGSSSCAEAVLDGDLSPAPPSVPGSVALVPMRKNPGMLSPAPKSARKSRGNEDADIADVVGDVRVGGIDMSPPASPRPDDGGDKRKRAPNDPAADDEDEEALLKKFKTAEALLLTPSPGAKRVRGGSAMETQPRGSAVEAPIDADDDAMGSPDPVRKTSGTCGKPEQAQTPTFNFRAVAAAVESSIAWLDDGSSDVIAADGRGVGDKLRWTVMHSLLAALPTIAVAAASACHATEAGASICGVTVRRRGGLGVDPRLASGTLRHALHVLTNLTNENPRGCAVLRTAPGALETAAALVPWCAALEGLIPNAGPSESARVAAAARSGATAAAGKKTLGKTALSARGEDAANANAASVDMLNAAMCVLVNASEVDPEVCGALRVLEADAGALEERRVLRNVRLKGGTFGGRKARDDGQPVRPLGLVELLAGIFVRSGGAGPVTDTPAGTVKAGDTAGDIMNKVDGANQQRVKSSEEHAVDGEVTADMLATETDDEREGDGLITQAYSALLTAFLVEGQPALRADVVYVLPEGGLNALASVLERFKTFHENLESISEASHASLTRIIRWLKGGS